MRQMRVPLIDLARLHAPIRAEIDAAMGRVIDSGRFVLGPEVVEIERAIAETCGVPHAVSVSSGTDALIAALWALGIGPGDEVITPAFSFVAAAEAIARVQATPVFVDIGDDFLVSVERTRARVTSRTRAIVVVDLFGARADVSALAASGVPIVEDAAQAIGAPGLARAVRAATLSFFPTKNLGAIGDGGMVLTEDAALADAVRTLRVHGMRSRYVHERIGGNMRLDALQAAVLRAKLPHLAAWTDARRRIARTYRSELAGVDGLIPPADAPGHVWHQFVLRVGGGRRDALRAHLAERGVETEVYYPLALHLQPCFASLGHRAGDCPASEAATHEALALPIHPSLTNEEIAHVVASVRAFFRAA